MRRPIHAWLIHPASRSHLLRMIAKDTFSKRASGQSCRRLKYLPRGLLGHRQGRLVFASRVTKQELTRTQVVFVLDLIDDLFKNVFQCNESQHPSLFRAPEPWGGGRAARDLRTHAVNCSPVRE